MKKKPLLINHQHSQMIILKYRKYFRAEREIVSRIERDKARRNLSFNKILNRKPKFLKNLQ